MKILFFSDHFLPEPSAPAAHVFERARLWAQWGHRVTVICAAPNFPEGRVYPGYVNAWRAVEVIEGIRVVRVKTFIVPNEGFFWRVLDYASYMLSSLFFGLFEKRPDVVISTSPHLFVAMAGVGYTMLRRLPHVLEVRDLWPATIAAVTSMRRGLIYRGLEALEGFLYRRSSRVLSVSPAFVEHLRSRGARPERIDVVINGANLDLFRPRPRDPEIAARYGLEGRFVIGYLGTLGLAHGLDNVLEAARLLRDERVTFFFVGVGAAKAGLQQRARELSLENVVFAPRQEKEEMARFLSVCDVSLVHLKDAELFSKVIPSKIFEAMAMGLPVLYVGPEGQGSGIVRRHEAGLCLAPGDPHALARAAERLAGSPDLLADLARNSLAAAPSYSRERQARDTLSVLHKAAAGSAPATGGADPPDPARNTS